MKKYLTNRPAIENLQPLFDEAVDEMNLAMAGEPRGAGLMSKLQSGDIYCGLEIRRKYIGFIMCRLPPFGDARICYSFVTANKRRMGHYTEMLKGIRKHLRKLVEGDAGIVVDEAVLPDLHELRGARPMEITEPEGRRWVMRYDLKRIRKEERDYMATQPARQEENRSGPDYAAEKAEALDIFNSAPWQGGGWGYNPHQYTVRRNWASKDNFYRMVRFIRNYGERVRYGREDYDVVYFDTHRVWNCSLLEAPREVSIINRKPLAAG